ncbi:MAG: insulinase family protein [Selenomonadaceae bacterium]|nr:insulinase family protein [Selenomonadaceae bacterium]
MQIGDTMHGFRLLKMQDVPEVESKSFEFLHEKSGAKLLYLQNKDDNKVFSIGFRTPPTDDTGVAHIIEHSVLCGSRKYPLKEPFVELAKGSLNTFLNAMTYPDKTIYPVASRNEQDFKNLMDVYLDAVFYPAIHTTPEILMQEGWHYEIEDAAAPLTYSGVVYNEMKGALSSPDDLLASHIMRSLYPDNAYGYESGGDPKAIPTLTAANFLGFHQKYYHPSNSYIYLYGDLDIEERLAYLDREYLSAFEKIPVSSGIERQKNFTAMKRLTESYPIGAEEETGQKTFLSLNWMVGDVLDAETMLGLEILEQALLRAQAAPLRKALLEANLGKDVDSNFETEMLQPFFSIIINGSEVNRSEEFYALTVQELKRLATEGIDKPLLQSTVNLLEFRLRESDFGTAPKGLIYGIHSLRSWLYDGDPTLYLRYEDSLRRLKEGIEQGYFEGLIKKYLLDNTHCTLLTLQPDREMAAAERKQLVAALAKKKSAMSPGDIENIIATTRKLKERQQSPESPEALATIPLLKLSDLRREAYALPLEERNIDGVKILFSDIETHGIAYVSMYFAADCVAQEYLPYVYLLSELLGAVDTESHSYSELGVLKDLYTGDIAFDLRAYAKQGEPDSFLPKFEVHSKALTEKLPELFALLQEILQTGLYTDPKRLRELLEETEMDIALGMQRSAHNMVASRLAGTLTRAGRYSDEGMLSFYRFVKNFLANFTEELARMQEVFAEILPRLFRRDNLLVSVTLAGADYDVFAREFASFVKSLPDKNFSRQEYAWSLQKEKAGLMSAGQVQYVGKGANYITLGYEFSGVMRIVETVLRYDYFWTKIRVQGGAYGAFANFHRNGNVFFGSYRDPNLKETIAVFDGVAKFLREFDVSDREMDKFIIGTMSHLDVPLTPKMKGEVAAKCYLQGVTYEDRQKARDEILSARQGDVRKLADLVEACMRADYLCVFGNEEKIKENADCFTVMENVND